MNDTITKCDMLAASKNITLDPLLLEEYPVGTLFWAVHHDRIVEPLCDPLVDRLEYVLQNKPSFELPVRLAAIRPVKHPELLPKELVVLTAAAVTAVQAYRKAVDDAVGDDVVLKPACFQASSCAEDAISAYECSLNTHFDELCALWLEEYPAHPPMTRFGGLRMPDPFAHAGICLQYPTMRITGSFVIPN